MNTSEGSQARRNLLAAIEKERGSKLITYFLADRQQISAQISEDAVRPMYDHILAMGDIKKLDLFIYSRVGQIEIPWRITSMIREHTDHFSVLVPYKAMSPATLIALGADEIVVGPKGELGPIDPQITVQRQGSSPETVVQDTMSVEDIMSYLNFLKQRVSLSEQSAQVALLVPLVDKLNPWLLGQIDRIHIHIRDVARKLLSSRNKKNALEQERVEFIVEALAEKTYQHGHAIGRHEAQELGLPIVRPSAQLERPMWNLFELYEELCELRSPIDARTFVRQDQDERKERVVMACIESMERADHFVGELIGKVKRATPPQLSLNLTQNINLPPNVDPQAIPAATQAILQQLLQDFQQKAQAAIEAELKKQMPVSGIDVWIQGGQWRRLSDWPTSA